MKKKIKKYLKETLLDERKRKPFLVGLFVFIIVFIGLTVYQQSQEKQQGDVVLTNGAAAEEQAQGEIASDGLQTNNDYDSVPASEVQPTAIFVDVGGAVITGGLYALPYGSRVDDAIKAAGGLTEEAEMKYMNRAAVLSDGDRLYIPTKTEVSNGTAPPTVGQATDSGSSAPAQGNSDPAAKQLININTADSEELQKLKGVGPVIAQKIIDHRTRHGRFSRIEDLMNVSGIGAKTFENLRDFITV